MRQGFAACTEDRSRVLRGRLSPHDAASSQRIAAPLDTVAARRTTSASTATTAVATSRHASRIDIASRVGAQRARTSIE
ncbi:hypothetical protein K7G19_10040 [Cupriavidus sp. DB3]|uniref:hypothetical protein n=1 Tax=Cupriavidus sp. DB3 TaxID=2873259 RepID=UPI001CF19256|nr:hypothetical protein [Cupriavidus sp. DB3]MCA7083944.1 hypothetical protein [Cupriavidus sp. DB3]